MVAAVRTMTGAAPACVLMDTGYRSEASLATRKTQGERPFAEIEQAMRFRRCQLRGRAKVWGEWNLVAAACVPRLPRQLCWPRHPGRAYHRRDTLASPLDPIRSLGSTS
jgi:hypothetical protein